jgi:hydroxyacylglutathione hydrolase
MNIETRSTGFFEENCYFAIHHESRETVVVDPGADAAQLAASLRQLHAKVVAYLLTHGHVDHVSGLAELAAAHPAPIYLHPRDAAWCFTAQNAIPGYYDAPKRPDVPLLPVADGDVLDLAGARWTVLETPGHTPGGVCYKLEPDSALFAGDTLFRGSAGRTDLPGGDSRTLSQSLRKLALLPDPLPVYSGHGEPTTIGHEKRHNYFMRF